MLLSAILMALGEIRRNTGRSLLTALGIVIGVAAVIATVTLGNSAMIIQKSNPGAGGPVDPDSGKGPDKQMAPGGADDDADRDPSVSDSDVYRQIRKGASPQSQQTLDSLMKALGLQKKM